MSTMAKASRRASVVDTVLCASLLVVTHLLEGCGSGAGTMSSHVMRSGNQTSEVLDKVPTPQPPAPTPQPPAPTPVPAPPPSNCCDGSQYMKCCACAAQSPAGFSGGFSICKGDNDCDCTSQDPTPGAKRSAACAGSKGPSYR